MNMKEKIEKMISAKEGQIENLRSAIVSAETKDERSQIETTLRSVETELQDAKEMLSQIIDEDKKQAEAREKKIMDTFGEGGEGGNGEGEDGERAKKFAMTGRMAIPALEARSVLLATGGIVKPQGVNGITDPFNTVSSIIDQLHIEDATGMGSKKVVYVDEWQEADNATDGSASDASDPTFKSVMITPFLMDTVTYVSRELKKQTPLQYEEKVKQGALIALRKKLSSWVTKGAGSTEIFGILNGQNTESTPEAMYQTLNMTEIDATTLRKIVFNYGGDENVGGNARLYLNKNDLIAFGDVRGENEKGAVYEITPDGSNPNVGIIKDGGLSVPYTICSDLTAIADTTAGSSAVKTMFYGDPQNYELDLFGNYEVNASEDYKFAEGLITIRGEVMVGGNIIVKNGFVVVTVPVAG